jgi:hypothetical protein
MSSSEAGFHFVAVEMDSVIVGRNVIDERAENAGVGPISASPRFNAAE